MLSEARALAVKTWREFSEDDAMQWGAALAYYGALALAPLLVTVLAATALFLGARVAEEDLMDVMGDYVGSAGADVAAEILADRQAGVFAGVAGAVIALIGATAVFGQLQTALNRVWGVRSEGGLKQVLKTRILGFLMMIAIGAFFLAALALQAVLAAVPTWGVLGTVLNLLGSAVLFTLLFAAIFKVLPDADIRWRDVWVGAAATGVLFTVGQLLLGLYLGRGTVGSAYGAAGSFVALLVWLYYSALVFLFGAEFTQVWARRHGRHIEPERGAKRLERREVEPGDDEGGEEVDEEAEPRAADGPRRGEPSEPDRGAPARAPARERGKRAVRSRRSYP